MGVPQTPFESELAHANNVWNQTYSGNNEMTITPTILKPLANQFGQEPVLAQEPTRTRNNLQINAWKVVVRLT